MNLKTIIVRTASCLALPSLLLVAACDNAAKTTSNNSGMTTSDTNATVASSAGSQNADNSANNVRDRNGATLTPGDQGNSDSDRTITQKIRQALVSGTNNVSGTNDYSVTAKNVKIITADGKVTLRGPVNTSDEKTGIESIAKNVAGNGNVDDQLEVKSAQ